MATVPLSGTNVRLLSGVPFQSDYKNTRWFDTKAEQTAYFLGKNVVHMNDAAFKYNFQRIEGKTFIAVNKSIDELWGTNYLMFQNDQYNAKWFYAFVEKLEYVQHNTTYVHFSLDVFQTWKFEMDFKPSYVTREHCKLWNSDGTPVINTVDEGLDYGTEYETVFSEQYQPMEGYKFLVIVSKTPFHTGVENNDSVPSIIGTPQPLSYYVVPFKDDEKQEPLISIPGTEEWLPVSKPSTVLNGMYKNQDAVNNIVSLYVTDYIGIKSYGVYDETLKQNVIKFTETDNLLSFVMFDGFTALYVKQAIDFDPIIHEIQNNKYTGFESVKESKLLMSPYCITVLDDFKGNRMTYKTEYLNSKSLNLMVKGSLGTSNKVSYGLPDYHFGVNDHQYTLGQEWSIINNSPSDIPIVTDNLAAFLQGNKNTIENQRNSIAFNGAMSAGNALLGGVSSAAMRNPIGVGASALEGVSGAGNTVLQLQAINAKQKDIANVPPQLTKMGSNTAFDVGNNHNGVFIIKKQIKKEYRKKLSDFFNMFGYKLNELKVPNFHTRKYWNYVQTANCTILGNFNNEDLQELKNIFDNGITLWHIDDVGNYSLENEVL